jgi:hypothetical protein
MVTGPVRFCPRTPVTVPVTMLMLAPVEAEGKGEPWRSVRVSVPLVV